MGKLGRVAEQTRRGAGRQEREGKTNTFPENICGNAINGPLAVGHKNLGRIRLRVVLGRDSARRVRGSLVHFGRRRRTSVAVRVPFTSLMHLRVLSIGESSGATDSRSLGGGYLLNSTLMNHRICQTRRLGISRPRDVRI